MAPVEIHHIPAFVVADLHRIFVLRNRSLQRTGEIGVRIDFLAGDAKRTSADRSLGRRVRRYLRLNLSSLRPDLIEQGLRPRNRAGRSRSVRSCSRFPDLIDQPRGSGLRCRNVFRSGRKCKSRPCGDRLRRRANNFRRDLSRQRPRRTHQRGIQLFRRCGRLWSSGIDALVLAQETSAGILWQLCARISEGRRSVFISAACEGFVLSGGVENRRWSFRRSLEGADEIHQRRTSGHFLDDRDTAQSPASRNFSDGLRAWPCTSNDRWTFCSGVSSGNSADVAGEILLIRGEVESFRTFACKITACSSACSSAQKRCRRRRHQKWRHWSHGVHPARNDFMPTACDISACNVSHSAADIAEALVVPLRQAFAQSAAFGDSGKRSIKIFILKNRRPSGEKPDGLHVDARLRDRRRRNGTRSGSIRCGRLRLRLKILPAVTRLRRRRVVLPASSSAHCAGTSRHSVFPFVVRCCHFIPGRASWGGAMPASDLRLDRPLFGALPVGSPASC